MNTVKKRRNLRFLNKLKDAPKKSLEIYKTPEPDWRAMGAEVVLGKGVHHWIECHNLYEQLKMQFIKWRASKKQKELILLPKYQNGKNLYFAKYHWVADVVLSVYKLNAYPYYDYNGKYKYLRKQLMPF